MAGAVVGAALAAAVDTAEQLRSSQAIDIVWTGPATLEVPVRLTREVLLDVVEAAVESLIVVSFAAYRVPEVSDAIARAAARGVDVRMVLETAVGSGGRLAFDAKRAFKGLVGQVRFFEWPVELRQLETGDAPAAMHAKGAIADEDVVLVTSANLTGSAIDSNMELGLLIRGGPVPRRLARHFRALMADDVLREVK